jgi:hypothetical protein
LFTFVVGRLDLSVDRGKGNAAVLAVKCAHYPTRQISSSSASTPW